MKKWMVPFVLMTWLVWSCSLGDAKTRISEMNGYWEIKKVELPDGTSRSFPVNPVVDYIAVEEKQGFRQKVKPLFNGRFTTSGNRESFEIKVEKEHINLYYSTPYDSWRETLLPSGEDELKIRTASGTIYTYKRFSPYSIKHEQKNK